MLITTSYNPKKFKFISEILDLIYFYKFIKAIPCLMFCCPAWSIVWHLIVLQKRSCVLNACVRLCALFVSGKMSSKYYTLLKMYSTWSATNTSFIFSMHFGTCILFYSLFLLCAAQFRWTEHLWYYMPQKWCTYALMTSNAPLNITPLQWQTTASITLRRCKAFVSKSVYSSRYA